MGNIGDRIREARKRRKITQEELAEKLGVTKATISKYELGRRQPRVEQLEAIASALDTPYAYFLGISQEDVAIFSYIAELSEQYSGKPADEVLRGALRKEIEERTPEIVFTAVDETIETVDALFISNLASVADVQLEHLLIDDFRKLNRRGKIEAVIRLRELTENLRFTFQEELEPDSTVTWDNPSETGETSQ